MSFLTKAAKAAVTAKSQLDEVRDVRAQASVKPVESAAFSEHEQRVILRARELGAPDPFVLLLAEEATEAAGTAVGGPHLTYGDDMIGARYEASGSGGRHWRVSVSAFHATDDDVTFDAGAYWFGFLADAVADDGAEVPGLGQVAVQRDSEVFVLADPLLLMVEVSTPGGEGDRERAVELARRVVQRLLG